MRRRGGRASEAIAAAKLPSRVASEGLGGLLVLDFGGSPMGAILLCNYLCTACLREVSSSSPVRLIRSLAPNSWCRSMISGASR